MKKTIRLMLALLLAFTVVFSAVGCTGDGAPQDRIEVSTNAELVTALSTFKQGQKIILKANSDFAQEISIPSNDYATKIIAEANVTVKNVKIGANVSDVSIENVNFYGTGLVLNGGSNITIKDCKFTGTAFITNTVVGAVVTNLTVKNCEFKDLQNPNGEAITAIRVRSFNGLTVEGCTFDNVQYNAIQIGANSASGLVTIKDNTFMSNIGSRFIYVVGLPTRCVVEGNYFYQNLDSYADPEDGAKKSTGVYIKYPAESSYESTLQIGKNSWQMIPAHGDRISFDVTAAYNYDASGQSRIQG